MLKGKKNIFLFAIIIFMVLIILFSNLGVNFKNDIFSYNNTMNYSNTLGTYWINSKNNQIYTNNASNYIAEFLSYYNIKPYFGSNYFEEFLTTIPEFKRQSTIEVISTYGKVIKKYKYNHDFFEDFKGDVKSGIVKNKFLYADNLDLIANNPSEIVLFDAYKDKKNEEIIQIDNKLKSLGVAAVISPSNSKDLEYDSNLYGSTLLSNQRGLVKFIVTDSIFKQLKRYSKKGYILKVNSGVIIDTKKSRNIYGVIKGKNKNYSPLIIVTYYDGIYKISNSKKVDFEPYAIPTSLTLDCIRSLNFQRLNKPDRTIVFVFLSRYYPRGKYGVYNFPDKNLTGSTVVFDGIGTNNNIALTYSESMKNFAATIGKLLNKNHFMITSKALDDYSDSNYTYLQFNSLNQNNNKNFDIMYRSSKFLLSVLEYECYNLDFLSGNIREFRSLKRFIRNNSAVLSIATMIILITCVLYESKNYK